LKEEQEKPIPGEGISDNELEVLPSNEEEEKEEILLTTTKPLKKPSQSKTTKNTRKNYPFNKPIKAIGQTGHSSQ
jgi:hypothetical protein